MKKYILFFTAMIGFSHIAHALYTYNETPASTPNPPTTMEQDPNVPVNPDIYGPATPLSKIPPKGTMILPATSPQSSDNFEAVNPASSATPNP